MTRPKFKPGKAVQNLQELSELLEAGRWIYWPSDGRPKAPGVIISMTFRTLAGTVKRGLLFVAEPVDKGRRLLSQGKP